KNEATRGEIKALQDKITAAGLAFERAVHDDVRTTLATPGQLEGLPADYLAAHRPDAEGQVHISTDAPDINPPLRFAASAELRNKLYVAARNVAYPRNTATLRELLGYRAELAHLLGYPTWADLAMADLMIGSPAKLRDYLKKIDDTSREPGAREDAALLEFVHQREPALARISAADLRYWQEQYRRARFDFDSQSVRPYFPY